MKKDVSTTFSPKEKGRHGDREGRRWWGVEDGESGIAWGRDGKRRGEGRGGGCRGRVRRGGERNKKEKVGVWIEEVGGSRERRNEVGEVRGKERGKEGGSRGWEGIQELVGCRMREERGTRYLTRNLMTDEAKMEEGQLWTPAWLGVGNEKTK